MVTSRVMKVDNAFPPMLHLVTISYISLRLLSPPTVPLQSIRPEICQEGALPVLRRGECRAGACAHPGLSGGAVRRQSGEGVRDHPER